MKSLKKIWNYKYSLLVAILFLAFVLRSYNLELRSGFDADAEWMAQRSKELIMGDLPLIGPTTSVGGFSIGPGYIYLSAIFSILFKGDPTSGAVLSTVLGVITILGFYIFCKVAVSEKFGLLIAFLVTISSVFISWDQNPWTPSLFYLAQIVLLLGAFILTKNDIKGWYLIAIGLVLGFQSHVGILISLFCILIYLMLLRVSKPDKKTFFLTLLIIGLGFLPNLVFDIFNNFANIQRLKNIFGSDGYNYLGFSKVTGAMAYYSGSVVYPRLVSIYDSIIIRIILAASLAYGVSLIFDKKYRNLSILLVLTAVIPPALFYLKQGKFSEYYIMMSVPSLVILTGLLVFRVVKNKILFSAVLFVAIFLNFNNFANLNRKISLYDKKAVVKRIVEMGGKDGYGVSLSVDLGQNFGFRYIFDYFDARPDIPPLKDQKKIFTIAVPDGFEGINGFEDYGGIGLLWQGL